VGWLNLEFGGGKGGPTGGVPGGFGKSAGGTGTQLLYIAATIGGLLFGAGILKALLKGTFKLGLRAITRLAVRQIRRAVPALRRALTRLVQAGSGRRVGLLRRLLRTAWEDRATFNMGREFFNRWRWLFGQNTGKWRWSMEHMLIKQRWYRGAKPIFAPGTWGNRLLQALGDSGLNLVPIPQPLNSALFRWPKVSFVFNASFYPAGGYGIYKLWQESFELGEEIADGIFGAPAAPVPAQGGGGE
jgi:hypothetical protein